MTARQLLTARDRLIRDIAEIDQVIKEIALSGYASASLSSGGGSKSYTRAQIPQLTALRVEYASRLSAILSRLGGNPSGIGKIVTVRC